MIKRYIRFTVKGHGEDSMGEFTVRVTGICDAQLDPMLLAFRRNRKLTRCQRVSCKVHPAFSVRVDEKMETPRSASEIVKMYDIDMLAMAEKGVLYGGRRRNRR